MNMPRTLTAWIIGASIAATSVGCQSDWTASSFSAGPFRLAARPKTPPAEEVAAEEAELVETDIAEAETPAKPATLKKSVAKSADTAGKQRVVTADAVESSADQGVVQTSYLEAGPVLTGTEFGGKQQTATEHALKLQEENKKLVDENRQLLARIGELESELHENEEALVRAQLQIETTRSELRDARQELSGWQKRLQLVYAEVKAREQKHVATIEDLMASLNRVIESHRPPMKPETPTDAPPPVENHAAAVKAPPAVKLPTSTKSKPEAAREVPKPLEPLQSQSDAAVESPVQEEADEPGELVPPPDLGPELPAKPDAEHKTEEQSK